MIAAMPGRAVLLVATLFLSSALFAQAHECPVQAVAPRTDADNALRARKYDQAEELYRAAIASSTDAKAKSAAVAGVIHTLVAARKMKEALAEAVKAEADYPKDAIVLEAVGDARFRHGETNAAAVAWNAAMQADPCNARVHYDVARFLRLSGMYASEQKQLDLAHRLEPGNRTVANAARAINAAPMTTEERIARLKERLQTPNLSANDRSSIERAIAVASVKGEGSCQIVKPMPSTKIPIFAIMDGPGRITALGAQLTLNGKKKRFEIDSGASGILINRSAAASAGILGEASIQSGGVGDDGPVKASLAHVDSVRIGDMEFRNCLVRFLDKKNEALDDIDGLIGPDVFSNYVVTLDFASREMRLDPLPKRSDESGDEAKKLDTAGQDENADAVPHDRYVAPEMQSWTKVYRYGHYLLFPTRLNHGPSRLFLMDTGAGRSTISPEAAQSVTSVTKDEDTSFRGISGEVANVMSAREITMEFANIPVHIQGMNSFDSAALNAGGVNVSGLIGFDALRELTISIDYRDNLVHVVYDPKARHAH